MYKGYISYYSEDATFDELEVLQEFHVRNLHPEHDGDIDRVSFRKDGNCIRFVSDDLAALKYVMEFASENEDMVRCKALEDKV